MPFPEERAREGPSTCKRDQLRAMNLVDRQNGLFLLIEIGRDTAVILLYHSNLALACRESPDRFFSLPEDSGRRTSTITAAYVTGGDTNPTGS